jgi:hypothetical protein
MVLWFRASCLGLYAQEAANALHLLPSRKRTMPILHDVSGIIKPRRYENDLALLNLFDSYYCTSYNSM